MDWMSLIGLVGTLAGSAAGQAASGMDREEVMRLIKSTVDDFGRINVPKLQQLLLTKQKDTELANIKDDPAYRAQQAAADAQLNDVINSGGLTIADKATLNAIRNKQLRSESAGRHAIENAMAARGTLDSGAQLAMQLSNNQNSAEAGAAASENAAASAQARVYNAILQRAQNAGAGLDRDYRQKANAASAQDAINKGNTDIANVGARYNAGIPQMQFENDLRLAAAKAGPGYALAGAHAANAKDTQQQMTQMGKLAGTAIGSAVDSTSDELSGEPGKILLGYDSNGRPIYGARKA